MKLNLIRWMIVTNKLVLEDLDEANFCQNSSLTSSHPDTGL